MLGEVALKKLAPLLESGGPDHKGEWPMHCPYHGDRRRSASLNVENELWNCFGCDRSGEARDLISDRKNWVLPTTVNGHHGPGKSSGKPAEEITEAKLDGWHQALLANKGALNDLRRKRGLTLATIKKYQLGWDSDAAKGLGAYTIPIRDFAGEICNVRRYQISPPEGRRKIWSVEGMGTPTLFPVDQLENDAIVVCEGEMDALLTIQKGIPAITRTGTADHWRNEWSQMFRGKRVYICHDMDSKGQVANKKVAGDLRRKADKIVIVNLPYEVTDDHGLDLTDFWLGGGTRADFIELIRNGEEIKTLKSKLTEDEPQVVSVNVMDSFDGSLVETPLAMQVTVTGKRIPSYLALQGGSFNCDQGAGKKCESCTLNGAAGHMAFDIPAESPLILGIINTAEATVNEVLRAAYGIQKCSRWEIIDRKHRTVEEIYVRPSIETTGGGMQDFTHRKVISAASHDLTSNQTVDLIGTIRPNPHNQTNEFQAWSVTKPPNALDSFKLTTAIRKKLEVFQTDNPMEKLTDIADDLAQNITKIYHRDDMHIFMDLTFHSGLEFGFGEEMVPKGWLDAIIIGDTRTGKSEAAGHMLNEYGMGEMISCESATYAGVVGGLDRAGDNRWIVKWGSIPVNDKRVVVLDEVSGLLPEQIAQMSSIRSSGVAEMTKIQNERALARTRLLWLANPRNTRMDDYTFGVNALAPLIGNNEDIARFDMAMGVFSSDVASDLINRARHETSKRRYSQEALHWCLRWAWTRDRDSILYMPNAVTATMAASKRMGNDYVELPPLVQAANVRLKIARVAVAIALRTFSCDDRGRCVVRPVHVHAAEEFLRRVYDNPSFGYGVVSDQRINEQAQTSQGIDDIMQYIVARKGLLRFLRHTPVFDRMALETVMNVSREVSSAITNELWDLKAVVYEDGKIKLEPEVLKKVRMMIHE